MRSVLALPVVLSLAACGNEYARDRTGESEIPLVAILVQADVDSVFRGQMRRNPDGSGVMNLTATNGSVCQGLLGAEGQGVLNCDGADSVQFAVPDTATSAASGTGVVATGTGRIGFGWGDDASVDTVRSAF